MNLGVRIKQARLALKPKMTQQQLANAVGVSRVAVTQWETGVTKALEGENLYRAAKALKVSTDWLLYGTGPGPGELPSLNVVKAVVNHQVVELADDVFSLAKRIQALPAQDRAVLLAMVDSLTHSKKGGRHESERFRVCDSDLNQVSVGSDAHGPRGRGA